MRNDGFIRGAGRPFSSAVGRHGAQINGLFKQSHTASVHELVCGILGYWTLCIGAQSSISCAEPDNRPFLEAGAWLAAGSVTLYFIYFLISCIFGMGASILIGGAGLLMTALMNTGLGDVIWKYNPWAWGIRLTGYKGIDRFVQIDPSLRSVLDGEIKQGLSSWCLL